MVDVEIGMICVGWRDVCVVERGAHKDGVCLNGHTLVCMDWHGLRMGVAWVGMEWEIYWM